MEIIVSVIAGVILGSAIIYFFLVKSDKGREKEMMNSVDQRINESFSKAVQDLIELANDKLGSEKKEIKTDLEGKRAEIERLVRVIKEDLQASKDELNKAEKERIGSFEKLVGQLEDYKIVTDKLAVSTENLKKVLSNNQLRGQFGEQVAENLLKMSGFVSGVDYFYNKSQETRETRPDFTVLLPDGTKINVDAKFPYAQLQKMAESDDEEVKKKCMKLFEQDVKAKIKQVTTRDYINPEENTVDFVILFIPNEMIFSYIYDKMNDIWTEAMKKKVIMCGPFSFTAVLRMVKQAYENFKFQSNIQKTINNIKNFQNEFEKFSDSFLKFGVRIDSLQKQYNTVSTTRFNQLNRAMDRVGLESSTEESKKIEDKESEE